MELIGFIISLIITAWVYNDAEKRGSKSPIGWAVGVLSLMVVFLPLYLIKRPSKK